MIPSFTLSNTGANVPALAFGSGSKHRIKKWQNNMDRSTLDEDLIDIIANAIKAGYTHLDTAEVYTTQGELAAGISKSGVDRSKIWICDKADSGWPSHNKKSLSYTGPREACEKGLKLFNIDYYDQYLIHSPFFRDDLIGCTIEEAWKQMEELYLEGKCKNIGVCNFSVEELQRIINIAKIKPQVNQIEYHLYLQNQSPGIIDFCKEHGILVEAFAPLTPILDSKVGSDEHPLKLVIMDLSEKYNVAPSSICLRWIYQSGVLPVTTSSNYDRMKQAFEIFDFELSQEDFQKLGEIGNTYKVRTIFNEWFDKTE